MKVLILGGGGFVGQKLARSLVARGTLRGENIKTLVLADVVDPAVVEAPFGVEVATCDISDPDQVNQLISEDVDVIYLLAAIVSGQAEEDLDLGMRINMMGTLNVLERCRALPHAPVVVFTSSVACFGGDLPDVITDQTLLNPQTSYGAQKAIGELLINDYSRRGLIDGRGFRLPTISVRPGKPNRAASGFMSSIFREPLNGMTSNCPVSRDFPHFYLSPRKCIENLIKGAEISAEDFGQNRCMTMPGQNLTIGAMIDAMTAVAGPEPEKLITYETDEDVWAIAKGWQFTFKTDKARALGLTADESFEENIRYYIEDDQPNA
ncbi:D-erythronate dehydrogenase [Pacificibacter marinus]|uniref:Putative epimerase/dehydratase n=1 Tax=Pacificibacter marinus TaxID=658057 RepID=A0A1Y5TNV5_9RHOB|nr:D-erythronate dehydrogenase [Pacificibacter marinus]SEL33745.1 Nucleoside-diphosphate-sugar epimerase [Pacificibacter marinus]SLN68407.1 putative epimerase/dehydratase [Pacificibacter marinus]